MECTERIPLGVSSCLLGEKVRYDGGHKRNLFIIDQLGKCFEYRPFCPEMSIGLGVPREPVRLILETSEHRDTETLRNALRVVGTKNTELDVTERLRQCGRDQQSWLPGVFGYIFKKDSPSCGMERVKYYKQGHPVRADGRGLYAQEVIARNPLLPCEEEGRLNDARLCENFVQRVYTWYRWNQMLKTGLTAGKLVEFHSQHKFLLMSRSQTHYRELGRQVADIPKSKLQTFAGTYISNLMSALKIIASRKNHVNVLQHIQGYLREEVDAGDRQEIVKVIDDYRKNRVPLVVPITLLKHYFRKHPDGYISRSLYLCPYPEELALQNKL